MNKTTKREVMTLNLALWLPLLITVLCIFAVCLYAQNRVYEQELFVQKVKYQAAIDTPYASYDWYVERVKHCEP